MNVKQLIEKLSAYDPETMVIRSGYEGGVTEVTEIDKRKIKLNVNPEWWYGNHEIAINDTDRFDCEAIYIV